MLISTQSTTSNNANTTAGPFEYIIDDIIWKKAQPANKKHISEKLQKIYNWPEEVFNNNNKLKKRIKESFKHGNNKYIRSIRDALPKTVGDMSVDDQEIVGNFLNYFENNERSILIGKHAPNIKPLSFANSMTEYTRIINDVMTNRVLVSTHGDIHAENFRLFKVPDNVIIVYVTPLGCTTNLRLNQNTKDIFESPKILYDFLRNPSKTIGVKPALQHAIIVPPGQITMDVNLRIEDVTNGTMMFKINTLRQAKWNLQNGWSEPPRSHPVGNIFTTVKAMCHAIRPDQNAVILVDSCRVINSTTPGNSIACRGPRRTLKKKYYPHYPKEDCPRLVSLDNVECYQGLENSNRLIEQCRYERVISNKIKG